MLVTTAGLIAIDGRFLHGKTVAALFRYAKVDELGKGEVALGTERRGVRLIYKIIN